MEEKGEELKELEYWLRQNKLLEAHEELDPEDCIREFDRELGHHVRYWRIRKIKKAKKPQDSKSSNVLELA